MCEINYDDDEGNLINGTKVCQKIVYVWTVFGNYFLTNTDIEETKVSLESL